jgi:adenylosuccinate lyase
MLDLHSIEQVRSSELKFRGAQGTTGTQASFRQIFQGDSKKYDKLNELLCEKFGFPACYDVSTQTYTRKVDLIIANAVAGLGSSAQKITGDIRHLAHWKEVEEPFESSQIGSSAMVSPLENSGPTPQTAHSEPQLSTSTLSMLTSKSL